ncbi:hypothetical protein OIV83_002006 [Microbotryomycetes sp. JL201]|nr:hypothetical protein OIV83_002006 [Microbotryomycetes sp. JL201]
MTADRVQQGGFSGTGLALLQELARHGAQVIALHPSPTDARILQLVELVRSSTDNERIYVEQCDMLDCGSIKAFGDRWTKDGRSGMVQDLEARIDAVIFAEGEGVDLAALHTNDRYRTAYLTSRHALVQSLLPVLLRSAQFSSSPIRIIGHIPPSYAMSSASRNEMQPWLAEGQAALSSLALTRESQSRLGPKGLCFVSACGGVTRSWTYSLLNQAGTFYVAAWLGVLLTWILWPLVWTFGKSSRSAAQVFLMTLCSPVNHSHVPQTEDLIERNGKMQSELAVESMNDGRKIIGGGLYRDGLLVRVAALDRLSPQFGNRIWNDETDTVQRILAEDKKHA